MPSAPGGSDPNASPTQQAAVQIAALYQDLMQAGASTTPEEVRRAWMTVYHSNETAWGMDAGADGLYDAVRASLVRQLGLTEGRTTTRGGTGGGGGGGPVYDAAAARAGFIEILRAWGLAPTDGDLGKVVDQAVGQKFTSSEFLQAVRATKTYREFFPGIRWRQGMTEGEYIRQFGAYQGLAKDVRGFHLSRSQFAGLLKGGIDAQEWSVRVDAASKLQEQPGAREGFAMWLAKHNPGLVPRGPNGNPRAFTLKEMYRIITGQASPAFAQAWDVASAVGNIQGVSGIDVSRRGAGDSVRFGMVEKLIKQFKARGLEQDADFYSRVAQQVSTLIPLSKLRGENITEEQILKVAFHGKQAPELTHKFVQLLENARAEEEGSMANPQLAATSGGGTQLLGYDDQSFGE